MATDIELVDKRVRLQSPSSLWPMRVAKLITFLTFPLIWVGGLVTSTDAGMAVPDWPTTYGYNMFLYPWETWLLGPWDVFIEHGHRLLGSLVGMVTIVQLVVVRKFDERPWMRKLVVYALLAVISQGILGGVRVIENEKLLAMLHGCTGPLFFALTVVILTAFTKFWDDPLGNCEALAGEIQTRLAKPLRLATVTTVLVYLQLVLGASVRHTPVTASTQTFSMLVVFHVIMGLVVTGHIVAVALSLRQSKQLAPKIRQSGKWLLGLVLLQVGLGVGTWVLKYGYPLGFGETKLTANHLVVTYGWWQSHITTAHMATGSLILINCVLLTTRLQRLRFVASLPNDGETK